MLLLIFISKFLCFRAKVQLENKKGHTALDIAKAYADPRVVAIVQKRWDEIPPPVDKKKRKYWLFCYSISTVYPLFGPSCTLADFLLGKCRIFIADKPRQDRGKLNMFYFQTS